MELTPMVYVAGPLSGTAIEYIANLHRMLEEAEFVRSLGLVPFIPGLDFLFALQMPTDEPMNDFLHLMSAQVLHRMLPRHDCLYAYGSHPGVDVEIEIARERLLEVCKTRQELREWCWRKRKERREVRTRAREAATQIMRERTKNA